MTKANGQMSKEIYLAGGCFWGAEHFLKQIEGVEATEVGYALLGNDDIHIVLCTIHMTTHRNDG